ncbi:hypothetical protein KEJ39_05230 [Candidatus Bathyarchaeota archaeon]|nr:hypothetical protein [Candidatus Bathyarchaeota archaeon]
MSRKILIISVVGGILVTLLTGLVEVTPPRLLGAQWYGYPLPWLYRLVVAPEYFPWKADPSNLITNIIFWAVIVGIVSLVVKKVKK